MQHHVNTLLKLANDFFLFASTLIKSLAHSLILKNGRLFIFTSTACKQASALYAKQRFVVVWLNSRVHARILHLHFPWCTANNTFAYLRSRPWVFKKPPLSDSDVRAHVAARDNHPADSSGLHFPWCTAICRLCLWSSSVPTQCLIEIERSRRRRCKHSCTWRSPPRSRFSIHHVSRRSHSRRWTNQIWFVLMLESSVFFISANKFL